MRQVFYLAFFFIIWPSLGASLNSELCKDITRVGKGFSGADREVIRASRVLSGSLLDSLINVNNYEEVILYLKKRRRFIYTIDLRNDYLSRVLIDQKEVSSWASLKLAQNPKVILWSKPSDLEKRNWVDFEKVELVDLSTLHYHFESNYYDLCHFGYPLVIQFDLIYDRSNLFYEDRRGEYRATFRLEDEFRTPLQVQQI